MVLFESGIIMLGTQIISNIINDTSTKVVSVLETSLVHAHEDVHKLLLELDLEVRLAVIGSLINHISDEHNKNESIKLCLKSVYDSITKISQEIHKIDEKIEEHKEKYFSNWRSVDFTNELQVIKFNSDILEKRFSLLVNIIKVESLEIR